MVRGLTAKYAMLEWAKSPPALWTDVVKSHFRKKADSILRTVEQWAQEPSVSSAWTVSRGRTIMVDIPALLPELQAALKNYGATYVVRNIPSTSSQAMVGRGMPGYGLQDYSSAGFGGWGRYGGPGGRSRFGGPGSRYGW